MTTPVAQPQEQAQSRSVGSVAEGPPTINSSTSVDQSADRQWGLRVAFRRLPCGVCVVTTDGIQGPHGMTASSVCSLSLDPPLLLVCVENRSATLRTIRANKLFAVNVLAAGQAGTSRLFASCLPQEDKFSRTRHRTEHGVPILHGAVAYLVCELHEVLPGGDHTIVIGRVIHSAKTDRAPLVLHGGCYKALEGTEQERSTG